MIDTGRTQRRRDFGVSSVERFGPQPCIVYPASYIE
jgi:hypothetical protein